MDTKSDIVEERGPSRYSMVVLAAKRAKQLKEGAPTLIDTESTNTLTVALEEIAAGKIDYIEVEEPTDEEAAAARRQAIAATAPPPRPTSPEMKRLTENLAEADRAAEPSDSEPESLGEAGADEDEDEPSAALADDAEGTDAAGEHAGASNPISEE